MTDELVHCFKVLDLEPTASPESVKQAYRELVQIMHPDRFLEDERLLIRAQEKLKEINGAYQRIRAYQSGTPPRPPTIHPEPTAPPRPAFVQSEPTRSPPMPPGKARSPTREELDPTRSKSGKFLSWFLFAGLSYGIAEHFNLILFIFSIFLGVFGLRGWLGRATWKVVDADRFHGVVGFYIRCVWRYTWRSFLTFIGIAAAYGVVSADSPETIGRYLGTGFLEWFVCSLFVFDVPFWIWQHLDDTQRYG